MKKIKDDTPILSFDYEKGRFNREYLAVEGETLEDAKNKANEIFMEAMVKELTTNKELVQKLLSLPDIKIVIKTILDAPEKEIPDDVFLDLVEYNFLFLFTRLGRDKVTRLKEELTSKQTSENAHWLLEEIGRRLAKMPKPTDVTHIPSFVALYRKNVQEFLENHGIFKTRGRGELILRLKSIVGDEFVESIRGELIGLKKYEIVDLIAGKALELTPETVRAYCKRAVQVRDGAFKLKKPL